MKTFSALLAICAGNLPVTVEFPGQRPVTRRFDAFFDLCLNKRLSKQSWGWWFETPSCPLWRHNNDSHRFELPSWLSPKEGVLCCTLFVGGSIQCTKLLLSDVWKICPHGSIWSHHSYSRAHESWIVVGHSRTRAGCYTWPTRVHGGWRERALLQHR